MLFCTLSARPVKGLKKRCDGQVMAWRKGKMSASNCVSWLSDWVKKIRIAVGSKPCESKRRKCCVVHLWNVPKKTTAIKQKK